MFSFPNDAANTVRCNHGGIAFVVNGAVLGQVPLPVIPTLRLTTRGVFDVEQQRYLPAIF